MTLEEQIKKLSEIGIDLNDGVSKDDLLLSFDREQFEEKPFDLILFSYGTEIEKEPWGRYFCNQAWNFDVEAIEDTGSYVEIVKQFHRITGEKKQLTNLIDKIDIDNSEAYLSYEINGRKKELHPTIDNDWADPDIVTQVMSDLSESGYDFYPVDNGQASIWFYLNEEQALKLDKLADNVFKLDKKPWWKIW